MRNLLFLLFYLSSIEMSLAQVSRLPLKESVTNIASSINWMTEDYPPYNYIESGELKGISVTLLNKI